MEQLRDNFWFKYWIWLGTRGKVGYHFSRFSQWWQKRSRAVFRWFNLSLHFIRGFLVASWSVSTPELMIPQNFLPFIQNTFLVKVGDKEMYCGLCHAWGVDVTSLYLVLLRLTASCNGSFYGYWPIEVPFNGGYWLGVLHVTDSLLPEKKGVCSPSLLVFDLQNGP